MKKRLIPFLVFCILSGALNAQPGLTLGVKAGLNFANITHASDVNGSSRTGYMLGGFIAPRKKKLFGFRSELVLSRQGYDFKTGTNTGNVNLDYLLLPQLVTINFTRFVQVQLGGQAAILLNARGDSSGTNTGSLLNYFSRFDYGLVGGIEVTPLKHFFFGARMNISMNSVSTGNQSSPWYVPSVDARNNLVQAYAGWKF